MRNLKLKRKLKGMTLIEIIIAIAIVVVMSTLLIVAASGVNSFLHSARDINDRVALQAPVAESFNKVAANEVQDVVRDADDNIISTDPAVISITINPDDSDAFTMTAKAYETFNNQQMTDRSEEFGRGLNMKFITDIEAPTEAPTP